MYFFSMRIFQLIKIIFTLIKIIFVSSKELNNVLAFLNSLEILWIYKVILVQLHFHMSALS